MKSVGFFSPDDLFTCHDYAKSRDNRNESVIGWQKKLSETLMEQKETWKKRTASISITDIEKAYQNPADFQRELVALINTLCQQNQYKKVIEIGCEMGVTSMLLDDTLEKNISGLQ